MTPLQARPERQKNFSAKSIEGLDINLVDYVAILICHSYPNKDPYSASYLLQILKYLPLFRLESLWANRKLGEIIQQHRLSLTRLIHFFTSFSIVCFGRIRTNAFY